MAAVMTYREPALPRSRQPAPFDARLLCAKLEAYQRDLALAQATYERQALAARRESTISTKTSSSSERRPSLASRKSTLIPQTAAKQFAATAMPMTGHVTQFRMPEYNGPVRTAADVTVHPKQLLAALSLGMDAAEYRTAREVALARPRVEPAVQPQPQPRKESTATVDTRRPSTAPKFGYRPGDAAQRRRESAQLDAINMYKNMNYSSQPTTRPSSAPRRPSHVRRDSQPAAAAQHDLEVPTSHSSRGASNRSSRQLPPPLVLDSDRPVPRPTLSPLDRPNWTQEAEDEDGAHGTALRARFALFGRKASHDREPVDSRRTSGQSGPADAASSGSGSSIAEQPPKSRRKGMMTFFKRSASS